MTFGKWTCRRWSGLAFATVVFATLVLMALVMSAAPVFAHSRTTPDLYAASQATPHYAGWDWLTDSDTVASWVFTRGPKGAKPGTCKIQLEALVPEALDGGVGFGAPVTVLLSSGGVEAEAELVLRDPFRAVIVPSDFRTLGRRAFGSVHLPPEVEEAFARTGRLTVSLLPGEADYHLAVQPDSVRLLFVG